MRNGRAPALSRLTTSVGELPSCWRIAHVLQIPWVREGSASGSLVPRYLWHHAQIVTIRGLVVLVVLVIDCFRMLARVVKTTGQQSLRVRPPRRDPVELCFACEQAAQAAWDSERRWESRRT